MAKRIFLIFTFILFGYLTGAYSYAHQFWPFNVITSSHNAKVAKELSLNFDEFGAFSNLDGKSEIACPAQTAATAVILVLGQSNSANHAEKKYKTQFPRKVLNYYLGKCYSAQSPILGASGLEGEYITPLGDSLIENGSFSEVIIINKSIAGSKVKDWAQEGHLSTELALSLSELNTQYRVTHTIWHQGESDFINNTSFAQYRRSFLSLELVLSQSGVTAPIFMVISTICGYNPNWISQNQVARAQKSLINNRDVFLGIDTDANLTARDRRVQSPSQEPNCHLSEQGQIKVADSISSELNSR